MTPEKRAWYDLMIADEVRNAAYKKALAMHAPGRTVVDVGAGLGHLSLWALEVGASHVTMVEHDREAWEQACERLIQYPHKVLTFLGESWSPAMSVQADVVVSEIFDSSGVGEGAIETLRDARRFLRPGGIMIPDWMRLHLCLLYRPVDAPAGKLTTLRDNDPFHSDRVVGGTVGPWFDWAPGEEVGVHVQRSGDVYGFGLAFTLGLAPGVTLTNLPGHPKTHWGQGALSFGGAVKATKGQIWIVRGAVDHSRDRLNPDVNFDVCRIEGGP